MLTLQEKERIFFDAVINFEGQFDADFLMKLIFGMANPDHVINDEILRSTKLHVAVISEDCSPVMVQSILSEDPSQLNQKNIFHVAPLHRAVHCAKNLDVVTELLKQGAHVNAVERSMMSPLHIAASNNNQYQYDLLQILIEYGGNVNCVDYINQSPLHMLVKNRVVQQQSLELLLENGADPNAQDKYNNSVLKVAIQNQSVSINVIETLLMYGANPDIDLKYCMQMFPVAKLLIQYIAVKNIETVFHNIERFESLPNSFVDLSFCNDVTTHLELSTYRENCINELMAMRKISVNKSCSLFKFISEHCSNARFRDNTRFRDNKYDIKNVLLSLKCDRFSYCSDLIAASFNVHDVLNILSEQGVYTIRSSENKKIYLNYYTIMNLSSFITKNDVINLTLAYVNQHAHKNIIYVSKSTKRFQEGICDSTVCMKRLKL